MTYGVKANIRAPHKFMRMGALVWVLNPNTGSAGDHIEVSGLSRGGRRVRTWIDARDLTNLRASWLSDDPQAYTGPNGENGWQTREAAQAWADQTTRFWASGPVRPHAANFAANAATLPSAS